MAFFEGKQMTAGYGDGPDIISSCTINANRGEIVAILGPNGAGKSTAMKAMLGLLNLKSGNVILDGKDISTASPQDRVKYGISFVPQTRNVFAELTVRENLEIGGFLRTDGVEKMIDSIYELFPILGEKKSQVVGQLSGGQRQQVALGRALMSEPSVLMLDEPSLGLAPFLVEEIFGILQKINKDEGLSVLLVEQNALAALEIVSQGYLIENGRVVMHGTAEALKSNSDIQEFYLGGGETDFHNVKHYSRRKRWLS